MTASADDDIRSDFLAEAGELVERLGEQLVALEMQPDDPDLLNAIFRAFHTVKGGAGFLALTPLVALCHAAEDVFNLLRAGKRCVDAALMDAVLQSVDQVQQMMAAVAAGIEPVAAPAELLTRLHAMAKPGASPKPEPAVPPADPNTISEDEFEALLDQLQGKAPAVAAPAVAVPVVAVTAPPVSHPVPQMAKEPESSVRVDTLKLDKMMNLVGELVLVRNRLKALRTQAASGEPVARAISELDFITRSLQNAVMQIRMQPIRKVFSRFPKVARDVARGIGKQVEVVLQGEDTDLDKNLVEALADPLLHMVRNSVDHGIELPEERTRSGKPAAGRLTLSAQQEGDHIRIEVQDDGAGMDPERIRRKAIEKGVLDAGQAAQLSADECLQLVFLPGFSTKEQISDLSGRGVGMDVVMSAIKALNGSVRIQSRVGHGSTVLIRVPLTLAILPALMVQCSGRVFALPLAPVCDVFQLDAARIEKLDRWDVVLTRRDTLRLVHLDAWLAPGSVSQGPRHVVVIQVGDVRYGFVVREVRGREEIVIKPLGASLRGLAGVAGATVLPDGRVALILDPPELVEAYTRSLGIGAGVGAMTNLKSGAARG